MPISLSSRWWINQLPKDLLPDYAKANLHTILDLTIQPNYAIQIIGNFQPCLLPFDKVEPSLSTENVYFHSPRPKVLEYPARILWYVSNGSKKLINYQKHVVAISYLDMVEVGVAKEVFLKYSRFGVLNWDNLMKITNGDAFGEIAVFTFSYTEILKCPVSYATVIKIIKKYRDCKPTLQSPYKLAKDSWMDFYQLNGECAEDAEKQDDSTLN